MSETFELMRFDPAYGTPAPYPSHPKQYRLYHGNIAWLFNPYSGSRRHPLDVGTDPFGLLCTEPNYISRPCATNDGAGSLGRTHA